MTDRKIVAVQYRDRKHPNIFSGKEFAYYSTVDLKVGDVIVVPTAYGSSEARVSKIDMKPSQIDERYEDRMKTIDKYIPAGQKCRVCGCTQEQACPGGCYWVEKDLCSSCAEGRASDQVLSPV